MSKKIFFLVVFLFLRWNEISFAQAPHACFSLSGTATFPVTQCGPFNLTLINFSTGIYDSAVWKEQISSSHSCNGPWGITFISSKAGSNASSNNTYSLTVDGSYKICLYLFNRTTHQTDSFCQCAAIVNPFPSPTLSATDTFSCGGLTTIFTPQIQSGTPPYGPVTWYFGDNSTTTTATATSVSHNYNCLTSSPPCYSITLSVVDANGCSKVITKPCYIHAPCVPMPALTVSSGNSCSVPATINLTASASPILSKAIYSLWFPPNSVPPAAPTIGPTSANNFNYTFTSYGCKDVIIKVKDSISGCNTIDTFKNEVCLQNIIVDTFYTVTNALCCNQPIGMKFNAHLFPANSSCTITGTLTAASQGSGNSTVIGNIAAGNTQYFNLPCAGNSTTTVYNICFQANSIGNSCNNCKVSYNKCVPITVYATPLAKIIQQNIDTVRCSINHSFCFQATQNSSNSSATFQWWTNSMSGAAQGSGTSFCKTFPAYGRFKIYLKVCQSAANGGCCSVDSFWVSQLHQSGSFYVAQTLPSCGSTCATISIDTANTDRQYAQKDSLYEYIFGDGTTPLFTDSTTVHHCYSSATDTCFDIKIVHFTHLMGGVFCSDTMVVKKAISIGHKHNVPFVVTPPTQCLNKGSACFTLYPINFPPPKNPSQINNCGEACHWFFTVHGGKIPDGELYSCDTAKVCISDLGYFDAHYSININGCADTTKILNAVTVKGIIGNLIDSVPCTSSALSNFCVKFKPSFKLLPVTSDSTDVTLILEAPNCSGTITYHQKVAPGAKPLAITHCFCASGTYAVTLIVKNDSVGCPPDTVKKTVTVAPIKADIKLLPIANDSAKCDVYNWCFSAANSLPSRPYNFNITWDFGDSTTLSGNAFNDTTLIRPCHTYKYCGKKTVKLFIANDCVDSASINIYIHHLDPNITATRLFANCNTCVVFTNNTNYCGGNPVSTYLAYGNGLSKFFTGAWTTDTFCYAATPSGSGYYSISDNLGCNTSRYIGIPSITGINASIAPLTDTVVCVGTTVNFINSSTGIFNSNCWTVNNISCTSGPPCLSNSTTFSNTFTTVGYKYVNLHMTNVYGCAADTCVKIHVAIPNAKFAGLDTISCPGTFDTLTNLSSGAYDNIIITLSSPALNVFQSFYYGKNLPGGIPAKVGIPIGYPGNYKICWKVISATGCNDSICKNLTVLGPSGTLTCNNVYGCLGDSICCTLITNSNINPIIKYPDGKFDVLQHNVSGVYNFCHHYFQVGHQLVQAYIDNGLGCSYPVADTVNIDGAIANFSWSPYQKDFCGKADVTMIDLSIGGLYLLDTSKYKWYVLKSNGSVFVSYKHSSPHVIISTTGNYSMMLIVQTTYGCKDTIIKPFVNVHPFPIAQFNLVPDTICLTDCVTFTNTSINPDGVKNYHWYFDWTNLLPTDTNKNPVHCYPSAGAYTIALVDSSVNNCVDTSSTKVVLVLASVTADYKIINDTICGASGTTYFSASSTPSNGVLFYWNFGDGNSIPFTVNNTVVSHQYTLPTTIDDSCFTTYLIAKTNAICHDSIAKKVCISKYPIPLLKSNAKRNCNPLKNIFSDSTTSKNIVSYQIIFGDGSANYLSNLPPSNLSKTYYNTSNNNVVDFISTYIISNKFNCTTSVHDSFVVLPNPFACTGGTLDSVCPGSPKTLGCPPNPNLNYNWFLPTNPNIFKPSNIVAQPTIRIFSTDSFYLTVQNQYGCSDTNHVKIIVKNLLSPTAGHDTIVCVGDSFHLFATGGVSYIWKDVATQQIISTQPKVKLQAKYNAVYRVIIYGACNFDSTDIHINTFPQPTISIFPASVNITAGQQYTINPKIQSSGTFSWTPNYNINCDTCFRPKVSPEINTTYQVIFTDDNGCMDTADVKFVVLCEKDKSLFIPNAFEPKPTAKFENRFFYVQGIGIKQILFLRVFDRWGNQIFNAENIPINKPDAGWDGTFKGKPMMSDVYMYQMQVECANGNILPISGNVTLIR